MTTIVTIARETGAGGSELAALLGARLGWRVLDRELSGLVATRLGLEASVVERLDEHPPSLFARIAGAMAAYPPESPLFVDPASVPTADAVAAAVRAEILAAAGSPPLVVVGHGAQCLLRSRADAVHVRLVAPLAERVRRVSARGGTADDVEARVRRTDDERNAYIRRYHQSDWRDPLLYDLNVNTGRVPVAVAVELVLALIAAP